MLYPLLIEPKFFINLMNDEKLFNETKNFLHKFEDLWEEIFILVDDNHDNLKKEYEKIIKKYSSEFPPLKSIIDKFLSLKHYKSIQIKTDNRNFSLDNISKQLVKNDVNQIIKFPDYFNNSFINLKKIGAEIYLIDIDHNDAVEKICSISRFGKKIVLNDAIIPYTITNVDKIKHINQISNDPKNFSYKQKETYDILINSIHKIISNIYEKNFFKDELEFYICTTINPGKISNILKNIKTENEITALNNLGDYISKCIKEILGDISPKIKVKVLVKNHYLEKKEHNDPKKDIYQRSIFSLDLDTCLQVRKGLDIFEEKSKNKLRNESSYFLKMMITEQEKRTSMQILSHSDYKAPKIKRFN